MSKHAKLFSPSKAAGWIACPGRPTLEAQVPDEIASDHSRDGTARHEACAYILQTTEGTLADVVGLSFGPLGAETRYLAEWVKEDDDYVQLVRRLADGADLVLVEHPVNFSEWTGEPADSFGTLDAAVVRGSELIIIDRKTGVIEVPPEQNKQLRIYALGMLQELSFAYGIQRVRVIIHQRTAREWDCSVDDLLAFGEEVRAASARVKRAADDHGLAAPGFWAAQYLHPEPNEQDCAYCKAMPTCPSMRAHVERSIGADFDTLDEAPGAVSGTVTSSPDHLAQSLRAVPIIEEWCAAVRAEAHRRLMAAEDVPGFKLTLGRAGKREWSDAQAAETLLRKTFRLPTEKAYTIKLISPTAAENLAKAGEIGKRQWPKAQALITRSDPKPTVVTADHPGEVYVPSAAQAAAFPDLS